jgi:hypothetical protein
VFQEAATSRHDLVAHDVAHNLDAHDHDHTNHLIAHAYAAVTAHERRWV